MFGDHQKKKDKEAETILTLIISSGSVEARLPSFQLVDQLPIQETLDFARLKDQIIASFKKILADTLKKNAGQQKITAVNVLFSSPWAASRTKVLSFSDLKKFTVKQSMIDELIQTAEKDAHSDGVSEDMHSFEQHIIHISINGYETAKPIGKEGTSLQISLVQSFGMKKLLDAISEELEKSFDKSQITFSTSALEAFKLLRDREKDQTDFLICDIGQELSEVSLIKDNILLETASFPKGRNFLYRKIAVAEHATIDAAVSLLNLYIDKKLNADLVQKIEAVLRDAEEEWQKNIGEAMKTLFDLVGLPPTVYMTGEKRIVDFFCDFLIRDEAIKIMYGSGMFTVTVVEPFSTVVSDTSLQQS